LVDVGSDEHGVESRRFDRRLAECASTVKIARWIHTVDATSVIWGGCHAEWLSAFEVDAAGVV